MDNDP